MSSKKYLLSLAITSIIFVSNGNAQAVPELEGSPKSVST